MVCFLEIILACPTKVIRLIEKLQKDVMLIQMNIPSIFYCFYDSVSFFFLFLKNLKEIIIKSGKTFINNVHLTISNSKHFIAAKFWKCSCGILSKRKLIWIQFNFAVANISPLNGNYLLISKILKWWKESWVWTGIFKRKS